jgi:hypothetical protein
MNTFQRPISRIYLLLLLTIGAASPLSAEDHAGRAQDIRTVVLYEGPLSHDENWVIKAGPDNGKAGVNGGTCSLITSDISNASGSSFERVTFEIQRDDLGIWRMEWKDSVSGTASDGNLYTYQQRQTFTGVTTDSRAPRPSRAAPTSGTENTGFLSSVPSNVVIDALELRDFFLLRKADGDVVTSSHVYNIFRLPRASDPPPTAPLVLFQQRFVLDTRQILAGQPGCDPL